MPELALPPYGPHQPIRDGQKKSYQGHKEPYEDDDKVQRIATRRHPPPSFESLVIFAMFVDVILLIWRRQMGHATIPPLVTTA